MKKHTLVSTLVSLACSLALIGCALTGCAPTATTSSQAAKSETSSSVESTQPELVNCPIERDTLYGGLHLNISLDEFNKLGFSLGDSLNVKFSNGYELQNVPYLNGYYARRGDPLAVGNPNDTRIKITVSYVDTLWDTAGLADGDTATVTLAEAGAFKDVQELFSAKESDELCFTR